MPGRPVKTRKFNRIENLPDLRPDDLYKLSLEIEVYCDFFARVAYIFAEYS